LGLKMAKTTNDIHPAQCAAILLAAGEARRFGGDKLRARLGEKSVLDGAAGALAAAGCRWAAVILAPGAPQEGADAPAGFECVVNSRAAQGISASIKCGVAWAKERDASCVLIALGDMPFVTAEHYGRLFAVAASSPAQMAYSANLDRRSPPALFGARWFDALLALKGDRGARDLLKSASESCAVQGSRELLLDIDTRADLAQFAGQKGAQSS
jgi:CTP:molybdopterin cytidylyltransferase MocA